MSKKWEKMDNEWSDSSDSTTYTYTDGTISITYSSKPYKVYDKYAYINIPYSDITCENINRVKDKYYITLSYKDDLLTVQVDIGPGNIKSRVSLAKRRSIRKFKERLY